MNPTVVINSYLWFVGLGKYDHFHEFDSVCADTKHKPSRIVDCHEHFLIVECIY